MAPSLCSPLVSISHANGNVSKDGVFCGAAVIVLIRPLPSPGFHRSVDRLTGRDYVTDHVIGQRQGCTTRTRLTTLRWWRTFTRSLTRTVRRCGSATRTRTLRPRWRAFTRLPRTLTVFTRCPRRSLMRSVDRRAQRRAEDPLAAGHFSLVTRSA